MNNATMFRTLLLALLAMSFASVSFISTSFAQANPRAHAHAARPDAVDDAPSDAAPVVEIVDRFGDALAKGDLEAVGALLDPHVLILESGGAERSRDQYLGHHAISDAAFLKHARQRIERRTARIDGDLAWVATERELAATREGRTTTLQSSETMVLRRFAQGWRIVHIHWSSRPKR